MHQIKTSNNQLTDSKLLRSVSLFISSQHFKLAGQWEWDLHSNAVYCSDVISFPLEFEGTKAIIHPDDVSYIKDNLIQLRNSLSLNLEFRIINTFGEVHKISGKEVSILEKEEAVLPWLEHFEYIFSQNRLEAAVQKAELLSILNNYSEKINLTGSWYINIETLETWYSDNVYKIYGIHPQSLNNHLYTFSNFLHPDDREAVNTAFDEALQQQVPLHLDFRIITSDSKVKNVRINTFWSHNKNGHQFLFGLLKDETENEYINNRLEQLEDELWFQKQLLLLDEEELNVGHWYVNLLTRKSHFSDAFLKLFGIRENLPATNFTYFITYIHPDDQQKMNAAFQKIMKEHVTTEIEFRVIHSNGKIRHLKLKCKLLTIQAEFVIAGLLIDITVIKNANSKLKDFNELNSALGNTIKKHEEFNKSGSWLWNLETNHIEWSDGIYSLMGYKAKSIELNIKRFLNFVIPEHRKLFQDNINLLLLEGQESSFHFYLFSHGRKKYINASFKLIKNEELKIFYAVFTDSSQIDELKRKLDNDSFLSNAILQNLNEVVIVTDSMNNIKAWNNQSQKLFNKNKEEVLNKNIFDLFSFLKVKEIISGIESALAGEYILYTGLQFSDVLKNVKWQMIPLINTESDDRQVLHIIYDLSKELVLENKLSTNSTLISKIVELSDDKIIVFDKNLNYLIWNPKCEEYFKVDRRLVIGRNILEFFPDSIDRPTYNEFRNALKGETICIEELKNKEGQSNLIYLVPLKENDIITGVIWIMKEDLNRDILSDLNLG